MEFQKIDPEKLPEEAIGESELERPQPADEPITSAAVTPSDDLYDEMRATIARLEKDQTARGDLKILSRTLLELRYAFKVFRPYRRRRKVTIFGSARTKPEQADYKTAVALGRAMAEHGWMVITGAGGGIMGSRTRRCRKRSLDGIEHHASLRARCQPHH